MNDALVGLGSNQGDRRSHLEQAVRSLAALSETRLLSVSSVFETEPLGDPALPRFLNGVAALETALEPLALLDHLQSIESRAGRPPAGRTGARTLDLDLLAYGRLVEHGPRLTLPHPGLAFRPFVLVPLAQIQPGWIHPRLGSTVEELLRSFRDLSGVRPGGVLDGVLTAVTV